ncbi:uncharacterized protein LOC126901094 isoform X3 [Daktulosphaira vitifoliae]|uniref:uncharacterized protein LOC126901094 isoform X3 n=1 Tax=Daktulosphaira vitifoliae TaxID=58002 RepID=UPI0021AA82D4|nr:uncharacterized protein LOC126901094 isoform X3 [Daktulosphaira vitifoliae]
MFNKSYEKIYLFCVSNNIFVNLPHKVHFMKNYEDKTIYYSEEPILNRRSTYYVSPQSVKSNTPDKEYYKFVLYSTADENH